MVRGLCAANIFNQIWIQSNLDFILLDQNVHTVKFGNKEHFDKEQIGAKELFMNYQPFNAINQLLDKELLPI